MVVRLPEITWSSPDDVVFTPPDAASTTVTLPGSGTYELTISAFDGEFTTVDTVQVVVQDEAAPPGTDVMFVVSRGTSPVRNDRKVIDLLEAAGLNVTLVDDDDLPTDLSGVAGVVISSSVSPSKVGATFADATVPVLTWEAYILDDMGLAAGGNGETSRTHSVIAIVDGSHPLAAGRSGVTAVLKSPNRLTYGKVGGDAHVVAHEPGRSNRAVLFTYDTGDNLANGGIAAARRVVLFPDYSGMGELSNAGTSIVNAAIGYFLAE